MLQQRRLLFITSPRSSTLAWRNAERLSFIISRRRRGFEPLQALRISMEHGVFCVAGWSLVLLMFLVGAGKLIWIFLLAVVMALENDSPWAEKQTHLLA